MVAALRVAVVSYTCSSRRSTVPARLPRSCVSLSAALSPAPRPHAPSSGAASTPS